jgi:photosystem II stability/assembly factor-like uncharacterized protein
MNRIFPIIFFFLLYNQLSFAQWIRTNGLDSMAVQHLAVLDTNLFAVIGDPSSSNPTDDLSSIYRTSDNGSSWENTGLSGKVNNLIVSGSNLIIRGGDGIQYASVNDYTWTDTDVGCWCLIASNQYVFAGTQGQVLISNDNGATWSATSDHFCGSGIFSIAILDTFIFAAPWSDSSVYRSNDNGESWSVLESVPGSAGSHRQIFASGSNLLAKGNMSEDVYYSDDYGISWDTVLSLTSYDDDGYILGGELGFAETEGNLFMHGINGVFLSVDHGINWINVTDNLVDISYVSGLAVFGTKLFASTDDGVWSRPFSEMITDVKNNIELPKNFTLEQNFPNPFTLKTVIRYKIAAYSEVQLGVFDLMGRSIATLIKERQQAGNYEVEWNASETNPGIYICELKVGQSRKVMKMIILQ